jgi:HK97 family phage prohead protease
MMPYYIEDENDQCAVGQWATVKDDGEVMGCHDTKQDAIDQGLAIALSEDSTFEGERELRDLPENYRPATSEDVPEGRACGNCMFFNESDVAPDGRARCEKWEEYVDGGYYCNAWEPRSEQRAEPGELEVGDFVRWDSSGGTAQGRIERIVTEGQLDVPDSDFTLNASEDDPAALIRIYREEENEDGQMEWDDTDTLVGHRFSTLTKIDPLVAERTQTASSPYEDRQVDLTPPAYMRAAARQGLRYYEDGLAGDGLTSRTVTEARQMARGDALTPDKWSRTAAWIARHMADLEAPGADPNSDDYPTPGVVAHLLWGSGPSRRAAGRAQAYAEGVVARLEEENSGRARGEAVAKLETRTNPTHFEIRELEDGGLRFEGYAAVFNSPSEPLPFTERIAPGAFARSIRSRNNIMMLWNHDAGQPLASTRAGTMTLTEDDRGLKVTADLAPTSLGRDISTLVSTRVIDSMSFGFSVVRDSWNRDGTERTLESVRLFEVSLVSFPAYEGTAGTTSVRGLERVAERAAVDADAIADVLLKVEGGQTIDPSEREMMTKVLDELSPQETTVEDGQSDADMLALKKLKLKLLEL